MAQEASPNGDSIPFTFTHPGAPKSTCPLSDDSAYPTHARPAPAAGARRDRGHAINLPSTPSAPRSVRGQPARGRGAVVSKDNCHGAAVRGTFTEKQVTRRYLDFTEKRNVKMFIGTWNVGAADAQGCSIDSWLYPTNSFNADMYVLGFQEVVDLDTKSNYKNPKGLNEATNRWTALIESTLPADKYEHIASLRLVGVFLCVYAKKELPIQNVMEAYVKGSEYKAELFGNKGGVGISMQLYDSDVCFVCTHLTAKQDKVQERNQDYNKILSDMKFTEKRNQDDEKHSGDALELTVMNDHDMVFWLGDLNYRLNCTDLEDVHSRIEGSNWQSLLPEDQLNLARQDKSAFGGFKEHVIDFLPTYKFKPNTNEYVRTKPGTNKPRFPAWCDRILWREGHKLTTDIGDVHCERYSSSREQTKSDHKPVFAQICFQANEFNQEQREMVRREIMRFGERTQQPTTAQRQNAAQKPTAHQSAPATPTATRQLTYEAQSPSASTLTRASSHSEERKEQAERPMLHGMRRRKMTSLDFAAESYVSSLMNYEVHKAKEDAKMMSEAAQDEAALDQKLDQVLLDRHLGSPRQQKRCGMAEDEDDTNPATGSPVVDYRDD